MKFIVHNLRMIRARLRSNGWVLAELLLVFIVMWFLCDSLGCLRCTLYRPLGYNIDHAYQFLMITGGESRNSSMTNADRYPSILQRLEREPAVEVAALSYWSLPMSDNNSYNSLAAQDTIEYELRIINATGGYTRVSRMKEDIRRSFAAIPVGSDATSGNYVMLSEGAADYYKERVPGFSLDTPLNWYGDSTNVVTQCGMISSFHFYRYGTGAKQVPRRINGNAIRAELRDYEVQIVFRVKESMDSPDYRNKPLKEIVLHLDTDNMFIIDVVPYTEQQYQLEVMKGNMDKVNTQMVVALLLLVNVFLGLIRTFWLRTRHRRNEIALRLAMGSAKRQISYLLMGKGLSLLTLVALPAMLVCYNVGAAELIMGHTELITTRPVEWSLLRFLLGSLGAWLLVALMVVTGIQPPARQAIDTQPAEALYEEWNVKQNKKTRNMRTDVAGVIITLVLVFAGALSVCAQDAKESEVRKVDVFSSIEIASVGTIHFTQSDTYSFRIEGKEKYVKNTETTMKNGRLLIGFKDKKNESRRNQKDDVAIWISASDSKGVESTGIGEFNCEKPLKLDEMSFEVKGVGEVSVADLTCNVLKVASRGVGSANIHVVYDYLSAQVGGVGDVTLSGSAGHADISKGGIGGVNTGNLKISR